MTGRLERRRAIVTGAASGIGAEIVRRFAAEGATVALLDIDSDGARAVADACGGHAVVCDVASPASVADAVEAAQAALGGLDIVVNAAGILARQLFETIDPGLWQRLFEINLRGPSLVIQAALPFLRLAEAPAIVNIASLSALRPSPGTAVYAATKAGLLMLTKCLAEELAPIRVNAICPGIVETPMTAGFMADPATRDRIEQANALHLLGRPADVALAAVYLASGEARFVTGTQIVIDGGSSFA
ncbi:SDR family NAD(P)-dependent oxidoreductase [uncultured Sphingomonas sp.]|uniref:SDR family NAD(P)-dependent oxidoreductase n=1 Tax=uncultured Sphingomonas sp. TaxID=158754 RepID=UPI0035CA57AF